ncbi:hypothetical protein [Methanobacterium petrolearium]|uniref:hypothetical protein n=1 Tax=Methanobacterium petrolearium TaxID=710190 RepID=UPI001AE2414D|nr:hypothetical protein [Methanobacterium petrolearium]MBP1946595.1 hypothetical protein [Methanobacterium petrolearium]
MEKLSKILIIILLIIVVAGAGFVFFYVTTIGFPIQKSDVFIPTISEENASTYKASCTELNISQVFENPKSLIGTKVKVKGELLQKQENFDNTTFIHLKVPDLYPNPYIVVTYSSKIPYNEGDSLDIYGVYDYPVLIGKDETSRITVPSIKGAYIEKV